MRMERGMRACLDEIEAEAGTRETNLSLVVEEEDWDRERWDESEEEGMRGSSPGRGSC